MQKVQVEASSLWILAQVVLVILKLAGVLKVSWWVIFLPMWLTLGAAALIIVFAVIVALNLEDEEC